MLYMATRRAWYLLGTLVLLAVGSVVAYHLFAHVQVRVETWIDPWKTRQGNGYQIIQAQLASGPAASPAPVWDLGSPTLIPNASTDFVFAAIGEELGLVGTIAYRRRVLAAGRRAFRIAADATRPFSKLFAAGIATIWASKHS